MSDSVTKNPRLGQLLDARHESLTEEESERLLREATPDTIQRVALGNLKEVLAMARRYKRAGLSFDDMVQDGLLRLIEVILPQYTATRGKFLWFIRAALRNLAIDRLRHDQRYRHRHPLILTREPTADLVDSEALFDAKREMIEWTLHIRECVSRMPRLQRRVLIERYGLSGECQRSFSAVAKIVGGTKSRISLAERRGLRRIGKSRKLGIAHARRILQALVEVPGFIEALAFTEPVPAKSHVRCVTNAEDQDFDACADI